MSDDIQDYLNMEPEIAAFYFKVKLDAHGMPKLVHSDPFSADIEVAVGCNVGSQHGYEILGVNAR